MYMNTQISVRGFVGILTIIISAVIISMTLPSVTSAHGGTHASSTGRHNLDATCMSAAVDDREDALIDAWVDMSSSTVVALKDRRDGLMTAWGLTSLRDRTIALVRVWRTWRADKKEIVAGFRDDRKVAWDAFKTTAKDECKVTTPKDESLEKTTSDSIAI
jgi:hypothetical protein